MTDWERIGDAAPRDAVEELESELVGSLRAPAGAREAVWQRVSGSLVAAGAATTLTAKSAASSAVPSLLAKGALVLGLAAPLAGGVAYWVQRDVPSAAPASSSVVAVSPAPSHAAPDAAPSPIETAATTEREPVVAAAPAGAGSPAPAKSLPSSSSRLEEENRLLRAARTAFRAGDRGGAWAQLALLDQNFPRGALTQERDYLRVQLAFAQGATDGARSLGRRFLQTYPQSPYGAHVESLLQAGAR